MSKTGIGESPKKALEVNKISVEDVVNYLKQNGYHYSISKHQDNRLEIYTSENFFEGRNPNTKFVINTDGNIGI